MKIHEFQAKEVLARFGIPVPKSGVATTPEEAERIARDLGGDLVVVKAQVHAGGRGKAGGVKLVRDIAQVQDVAGAMLGTRLVTYQSEPDGQPVNHVLVEEGLEIDRELYVAITLDRSLGCPSILASSEGGVDIEEVARDHPDKIFRAPLYPGLGLQSYQARRLAFQLGLSGNGLERKAEKLFLQLARLYEETDASMAELNPLVVTGSGQLIALDAKLNIDGNALYRQKGVQEYRDPEQEDPREREAGEYGLSYIGLEGNIGCMVNGAGLAMSTMDIIKYHGGEPANFLDVGGGATQEKVAKAFEIILRDEAVKAILVNIFGGIMKCDVIARGVIEAAAKVSLGVPLVVRLEGTNVEEGRRLLDESGLNLVKAENLTDAARKVVAAANS